MITFVTRKRRKKVRMIQFTHLLVVGIVLQYVQDSIEDSTMYIAHENSISKTVIDERNSTLSLQELPFITSDSINFVTVDPRKKGIIWGDEMGLNYWEIGSLFNLSRKLWEYGCGVGLVDLVFILDSSGSLTPFDFEVLKIFLSDFLKNADIDSGTVRVGVVSYSNSAHVEFQLKDYKTLPEVLNAINKIPFRDGNTNTADGLRAMHDEMFTFKNGDRVYAPNIAILITDGVSNRNAERTIPEAELAKAKNIHIYTIGIGLNEIREVFEISSMPVSENAIILHDFNELYQLKLKIFQNICSANTLRSLTVDWIEGLMYINLDLMRNVIILDLLKKTPELSNHIDIQRDIHAVDTFHRRLYQVPSSANGIINEILLDRSSVIQEQRLIINLDGVVISSVEVDAKDGRLYYITALPQRIYTLRIDDGTPQQLLEVKGHMNVMSFTLYGEDLFWIERSLNSSYRIMNLQKYNQTEQKTVFKSNKEILGIAVSDIKSKNKENWSGDVSKCWTRDGSWRLLTKEKICDGKSDCYGDFDEFYCCNATARGVSCGIRNIKFQCGKLSKSLFGDITMNFIDLKLPFSKFLSAIFASMYCTVKGDYIDNFGLKRKLHIYYGGQAYLYRQFVGGDVFKEVNWTRSLDLIGIKISAFEEKTFSNFQSLTDLTISKTTLESIDQDAFLGINNLDQLRITANRQLKTIDKNGFNGLHMLKLLNISNNALTDLHSDTLTFLESLQIIDLRGNDFRYTNTYFKRNDFLSEIYSDSYIVCCMKPPSVTDENCKTPKDAITGCDNLINDWILRYFLWIIGITALLGNIVVIMYRGLGGIKRNSESFIIFVTNLTVSDGLMGFYMLNIAFHDLKYSGKYAFNEYGWKNSFLCNLSGTVSFLSSEASVIFILLITIDRFLAVRYPIRGPRITRRIAYILVFLSWIVSLLAAIIPGQIYHQFYSYSGVCVALPITSEYHSGQQYSVAVFLGFNFVTFIMIAFGQYFIFREIKLSSGSVRSTLTSRDRGAAKMLLMVVITDCFCWLPIGILIIMSQAGVRIPDVIYAWVVVFVLPINSAINPFIYTLGPGIKRMLQKIKTRDQSSTTTSNDTDLKMNEKTTELTDTSEGFTLYDKKLTDALLEPDTLNELPREELNDFVMKVTQKKELLQEIEKTI